MKRLEEDSLMTSMLDKTVSWEQKKNWFRQVDQVHLDIKILLVKMLSVHSDAKNLKVLHSCWVLNITLLKLQPRDAWLL